MDDKNHKPESSEPSKNDCKRIRRMNEITIMDLPRVIMVEILSRLPIKSIFCCKTVCKLWYHIFSDPLFVKMYHTTSSNFPCILLQNGSITSLLELKVDYDYYTQLLNRPILLSPEFHLPPLKSINFLIGSCNGLICLLDGSTYDENHSVYINNPLLGEYFKLKLPEWDKSFYRVAYAFCFSEASGQYKVLRFVVRKFWGGPEVSELEVYTLGIDEKWRNVGQVPSPVRYYFGNANDSGALHWLDACKNYSIYSFDIGTEKLKSLPPPPGLKTPWWCLTLAELGNCLCLTVYNRQRIDIWWMQKYGIGESWTKDSILVDSIPFGMGKYNFEAILIWKDGEILMRIGTQLASYNPKKKKFGEVNAYSNVIAVTRYIPSFYSLKTVMGDNFQVSNVYSKTQLI